MLKELLLILKQGAVLAVGNVGQRILQFALLPIYTRLLSPADFGIIEMLTIFCTFFSLFALLGTRQGFTRNYLLKEKNSAADSQNKDKVLNTSIWFVTIWGILLSVLGLYFSDSLGHFLLKSNDYNNLMIMSIFWGLGLAFNQIPQAHFLNNGKMGTFVIISTVQLLINLGLIIYWVVWYKMGVEGIIRANAITQLTFGLGLNAVLLIKHRYFINVSILKKILRFGVPAMFSGLLITSFYMIDRLFINKYLGLHDLGLYAIGRKIAAIISLTLLSAFCGVWSPYSLIIANRDDHKIIIPKMLLPFVCIFATASLGISLFSHNIISLITTPQFYDSYRIVIWLSMGYTAYAIGFMFYISFNIVGKSEYGILVNILTMITGVLLNILLIPRFGINGAAIATFATLFTQATLNYFIAQRLYHFPYPIIKTTAVMTLPFIIYFTSEFVRLMFANTYYNLFFNFGALISYSIFCYHIAFDRETKDALRKFLFK